MEFDFENFGLGVLAGWATAYGVYRARHAISDAVRSVNQGAQTVQNSATRSADSRYISDLIDYCETQHLAGKFTKLSDIVVEPRFVPPPEFVKPHENDVVESVYRVVPHVPDHPYLQAPFNIETLAIPELAQGARALALLGVPGSGRTTALLTIALHSLGRITFTPPPDKVQERLDAEEAKLAEKERAVRVQERIVMEQRAKERLATEGAAVFSEALQELRPRNERDEEEMRKQRDQVPLFRRLMPVYVHFADLLGAQREIGRDVDPAEPVVRAVQYIVKRVTASTIPRNLYKRIAQGQTLMLIDGFDDLPEAERPAALAWLQAFLNQYGDNFVIVTGPAVGYGGLTRAGLTPVFMRPWSDLDAERAVTGWADAWTRFGKRRRKAPDDEALTRARAHNRALSPFEISLKVWAAYADDTEHIGVEGWLRAFLKRYANNSEELLKSMAQIAALQLEEGYVTAARLQALAAIAPDAPTAALETPTSGSLLQTDANAAPPEEEANGESKEDKEDTEKSSVEGRLLGTLRRAGVLVRFKGDRYQFRHPLLAAYLASLTLAEVTPEVLLEKSKDAAWRTAFPYAALHLSLDNVVKERLQSPSDVLGETVIETARWLAYAPNDVRWRGAILNTLGNQIIQPNQYPLMRERAAAALIDSRDQNVLLLFRRAVRNIDSNIRRLACLGMGALGDPEGVRDLAPLLNDQDANVQLAAGLALGAIGTTEALEPMVIALTSGDEQLRQAMAEAFAALPEEGYPTLFDAVRDEDFMLRRAAIFGLRRLRTTWALVEIYRAFLDDEQWYVRSAAQQAFTEIQYGRTDPLTEAYPIPEQIEWLKAWASRRGETVPPGEGAHQMLLRALQEGDAPMRMLAARSLGQLGMVEMLRALYGALRDGREEVRAAAYESLGDLQLQIGRELPAAV